MVFALFWSENGYRLRPFRSGIGYDFRGNYGTVDGSVWTYLSFLFQMNKKEREIHKSRLNGLKKSSLLVSNIGNNDIISWAPVRGQVWKRVWIFKGRPENGREKWHFLVWNRVRIWRTARHAHPHQKFPGVQPPHGSRLNKSCWKFYGCVDASTALFRLTRVSN